ncbi:MAG: hypothetical protein ACOCZ3_00645 [Bacillota bacterium]
MSNYEWRTKKEIILEGVQKDPFLKIEELAKRADTTPRYVRTILSEANVSLMKLRKEYARKMETRHRKVNEQLLITYLLNVPFAVNDRVKAQNDLIFNNPGDFNKLPGNIKEDYYHFSYLHTYKSSPWCINTVIIDKEYLEADSRLEFQEISDYLGKFMNEEFTPSAIKLEIERSTGQVAGELNVSPLTPIFRGEQSLYGSSKVRVLMLAYFNPDNINISLSVNNGLVITRKHLVG